MTDKKEIPQRLRYLRGLKKIREAAKKAGVLEESWSQWESGHVKPNRDALFKIAAAFDVSPRWILEGEGEEPHVAEAPESYEALDRSDQKLVKEVEELLRDADNDIKRHLRNQIKLLRRVQRAPKKRASGED